MKRRYFLASSLASAAALTVPAWARAARPASALRLTLVCSNDIHSHMEPLETGTFAGLGGAAARTSFVGAVRAREKHVLLLDSGDMFQGTPYFNIFKGEPELKTMSAQGYVAGTIGNHDFDAGVERLAEVTRDFAQFPLLNCNYDFSDTPMNGLTREHLVLEREGLRIGLLGLGIKLDGLVPARWFGGTQYRAPIDDARRVAQYLRNEEQCDFIIALSHININHGREGGEPGDRDLITAVPEIDVILGGHNHYLLPRPECTWRGDDATMGYVAQAGWAGSHMGYLQFDIYGQGEREVAAAHAAPMTADRTTAAV